MNPQIPIEARQTVLDFLTAGTSFTAYEVTLEVRRRLGTSVDVPHGAVNGIVQQMFANGEIIGYDRRPDATVQSATPPFRYYQIGGQVAAPFAAPTAPAISRSNLPLALRFSVPFNAMMRNLGIAARDFQRVSGKADEPFAVWLPTLKEPTFRLRCYGDSWQQSEIENRFTLDLTNPSDAELIWLSALAYADEFRFYSNRGGTQVQFLIKMDAALQTSAIKEAERATGEPDGLQIEVAIRNRDINMSERALRIYKYLSPAPRVYRDGKELVIAPSKVVSEGNGWKLTDNTEPLAIVDEVAYSLLGLDAVAGIGVELYLDDAEVEPSLEKLVQNDRTRTARRAVIDEFKREVAAPLNQRFENAPNLWEAKILWRELFGGASRNNALQRIIGDAMKWSGIAIENADFRWNSAPDSIKVRKYLPTNRPEKPLMSTLVGQIEAASKTLIFINDLGFGKSATSSLVELFRANPFEVAYVVAFQDEAARAQFFRECDFGSVPTRFVSELPKPARTATAARPSNRKPFDAKLHQPKAPTQALAAAFAAGSGGSDSDFENLKTWARQTPLDGANWPDFKRLYKAIEAHLWPPMGRFRWEKSEADFPTTPIPTERELELLGVLMGRLDQVNASRSSTYAAAPQLTLAQRALSAVGGWVGKAQGQSGPSNQTLAYMKRRATRLLLFLRDNQALSPSRREALAPLVCGLLQRDSCLDIEATLPLRLKLVDADILANHPGAIARVWGDASLPLPILRWAYGWLEARGRNIAVSPAHLQRFVEFVDVDWTLKLAPAALSSSESWPEDFTVKHFSQVLQGNARGAANAVWQNTKFLEQRDQIIDLFARFPQLELDKRWLRDSLSEVSDPVTLDWLMPWLGERAQNGELALAQKMSPALQSRFSDAIVAALPNGLALENWKELVASPNLVQALAPALRQLPISDEIADYLWALDDSKRATILAAIESNPHLVPLIEARAGRRDWAFAATLSPMGWSVFARAIGERGEILSVADWRKVADLPVESGYEIFPLGASFWQWILPLESAVRARWIERVGAQRAGAEFAGQSAAVFEELLDSDASGLDQLGDAWLDANLQSVPLDGELIIKLAQSSVSDWQARALRHLEQAELRLPVALRLMESELPILERVAAPYFSGESPDWSDRILALADSPRLAARRLALRSLEEFPDRWTPDLLRNLAQHDDAGVQAFVAAQLGKAPDRVVGSKAIGAFDEAILNARGRARRAKNSVQMRLAQSDEFDREALLDAARNGAPRDREWALQQLVKASLAGADVEGLEVGGAFAKAT